MADAETAQQRLPAIDDGTAGRAHAWRTTFAALCATLVGIGLTFLFAAGGSYATLFTIGAAALLLALLIDLTATIEKRDDA